MKSTYKLLGIHWDRLPLPKDPPRFYCCNTKVRRFDEEYDLLDWKYYVRKIPFSELLETKDMQMVDSILLKVNTCDAIVVEVDYFPLKTNPIVCNFLVRRLLQMYGVIMNHCCGPELYIMYNEFIQKRINQEYRKKHD